MSKLARKLWSPLAFDILFGLGAIWSFAMMFVTAISPEAAIASPDHPLRKGGAVILLILISVLIACFTLKKDLPKTDDFTFMTLGKSALIGMFAFGFFAAIWAALFDEQIGELSGLTVSLGVFACWSVGYLYTRIVGTSAQV